MTDDIVTQGRDYVALNAAESGADVLILGLADEVDRLRARATQAHDALREMFWEGSIYQEDANKIQAILRGDDEQNLDRKDA